MSLAEEAVARKIAGQSGELAKLSAKVVAGELDPYSAAESLLKDVGISVEN